jgi:hypothetical protein
MTRGWKRRRTVGLLMMSALLGGCVRRHAEVHWMMTAYIKYDGRLYIGRSVWGSKVSWMVTPFFEGDRKVVFLGHPIMIGVGEGSQIEVLPNGMYFNQTSANAAYLVNIIAGNRAFSGRELQRLNQAARRSGLTIKIKCSPPPSDTRFREVWHCFAMRIRSPKIDQNRWRSFTFETAPVVTEGKFEGYAAYLTTTTAPISPNNGLDVPGFD